MVLPVVFAQPTERNDRIISLLSAVLMRRVLRPDFYDAVAARFPSSLEACLHCSYAPVVIIVECESMQNGVQGYTEAAQNDLSITLNDYLRSTAMVSIEILVDTKSELEKRFQQIQTAIHPNAPLFIISLFSACELIHEYFDETAEIGNNSLLNSIVGFMSIYPDSDTPLLSLRYSPLVVPTIVITNDLMTDDEVKKRQIDAITSCPNLILVKISSQQNNNLNHVENLWIARTMLKFINATLNTMDEISTFQLQSKKTTKLLSRL